MMSENVTLKVNGDGWDVFEMVTITRSLRELVSTATVTLATSDPQNMGKIADMRGAPAEVWIEDERALKGYVVSGTRTTENARATLTIASLTVDVHQCSTLHAKNLWRDQTVADIASSLLDGYGLDLQAPMTTPTVKKFKADKTETVFSIIDRLSREQGYLLTDTADGAVQMLSVETLATAALPLEQGTNLENLVESFDLNARYSEYRVRGQTMTEADAVGTVADSWTPRNRVLTIDAERSMAKEYLTQRAQWEAATRAGGSIGYTARVGSWRQEDGGQLWRPGLLVKVRWEPWDLDDWMLIVGITLAKGPGTSADLILAYADGYTREPDKIKKKYRAKPKSSGAPSIGGWVS